MKVCDLTPGIVFETDSGIKATLFAMLPQHPIYPTLSLVIWIMDDNTMEFDALHPNQELYMGTATGLLTRNELQELFTKARANK